MTYARWFFWIHGYDKDSKITRYQALKQVEKQLGRPPAELQNAPKLDDKVSYLFDLFLQLKTAYNVKISYQDMQAFEQMTGIELSAFDVDTLKALDKTHWSVINGG